MVIRILIWKPFLVSLLDNDRMTVENLVEGDETHPHSNHNKRVFHFFLSFLNFRGQYNGTIGGCQQLKLQSNQALTVSH